MPDEIPLCPNCGDPVTSGCYPADNICRLDDEEPDAPTGPWCPGVGIAEIGSDGRYVAAPCGATGTHGGHW